MKTCPLCNGSGKVESPAIVGARLKVARKIASLTLNDVSKRLSRVSASYLCDLEHGNRNISPALEQRILKAITR